MRLSKPKLEILEDRTVPADVFVTNGQNLGLGSLRNAVAIANAGDTIKFQALGNQPIVLATQIR